MGVSRACFLPDVKCSDDVTRLSFSHSIILISFTGLLLMMDGCSIGTEAFSFILFASFTAAFSDFLAVLDAALRVGYSFTVMHASVDEPSGTSGSNCYCLLSFFTAVPILILPTESLARIVLLTDWRFANFLRTCSADSSICSCLPFFWWCCARFEAVLRVP